MTAKPESVADIVREMSGGMVTRELARFSSRILTAHRAELAEALKEPTEDERVATIQTMLAAGNRGDYLADFIASRRRKHGVDK